MTVLPELPVGKGPPRVTVTVDGGQRGTPLPVGRAVTVPTEPPLATEVPIGPPAPPPPIAVPIGTSAVLPTPTPPAPLPTEGETVTGPPVTAVPPTPDPTTEVTMVT